MRLPIVKSNNKYRRKMVLFGGINRTQSFTDGELYDCDGISHSSFPSLTQAFGSTVDFKCNAPSAAAFYDKKCIAAEDALYVDGKRVGELSPGKKSIAYVGYSVVVFPDKVYYNTVTQKFASLENECILDEMETTFTASTISVPKGTYKKVSIFEETRHRSDEKVFKYASAEVIEGKITFSGISLVKASELKDGDVFSESSAESFYRTVNKSELGEDGKITILSEKTTVENLSDKLFENFREGDVVQIEGSKVSSNNKSLKIKSVSGNTLTFDDGVFSSYAETSPIIIKRKIPDLTCICEYENRLWGCEGNTIYASALGDPLNFFKYDNLSTDSYAVQSNTMGDFTAIADYSGYCLVFKEDKCYKLFGNKPSNFKLTECVIPGILKGEKDSVVNLNGILFYKGNGGIFAFGGGVAQKISDRLGNTELKNCSAGGEGTLYYISGEGSRGREEFVYDTERNLWSKSGEKDVAGYFSRGEELYRLKSYGVEKLTKEVSSDKEWYAEFCPFDENYHKTKNYSKLYVAVTLFDNSCIKAEMKADNNEWKTIFIRYGTDKEHFTVPCVLKGCNEARLRLSGKGKCIVQSIVREFSVN